MSIIDVDVLMQDIGSAPPSGPNLEYDPAFHELEQAVLGKPEVQYGDTITPAVPPEWKVVKKLALELLARSRDLRAALPLARALLALHGTAGFADGIRLVERMLDEHWDSLHPQLDPDDDNDPMLRINSLASLTDAGGLIRELKDTPFLQLPGLGALGIRQLEMAHGELAVPQGHTAMTVASIMAAAADLDPQRLQEALDAAARAHASAANIEVLLVRQVGSSQALNLDQLTRNLKRMRDFLASLVPAEEQAEAAAAISAEGDSGAASTGAAAKPAGITGEINTRADVLKMLDKILAYYEKCEPSSPVPMLLQRAKRLAPKSFFDIMQDLAPDSVSQLSVIRGPQEEQ
jgi:type VI secretion system protein ImpA